MMIRRLISLAMVLLLFACGQPADKTLTVAGHFTGAGGKQVMLAELPFAGKQRIMLDSATLDSNGKFLLRTVQREEGVYQLLVVNGPGILFINDAHSIQIEADARHPESYRIAGSPASASIQQLYAQFSERYARWQQSLNAADSFAALKKGDDSIRTVLLQKRDNDRQDLIKMLTEYLQQEPNATARYFGLGIARNFLPGEQWNKLLEADYEAFPRHAGISLLRVRKEAPTPGSALLNKPVPELFLPDTSGNRIAISSFRGRWLFIHCWAAWCAPCREKNPMVVEVYRSMKSRQLAMLSISLDKNRADWIAAIQKDELSWPQVSDLKYWESAAVGALQIEQLPYNLLVDPKGVVKAVNIPDSTLGQSLKLLMEEQ